MGTGTGEAERVAGPPLRVAGQGWGQGLEGGPSSWLGEVGRSSPAHPGRGPLRHLHLPHITFLKPKDFKTCLGP